MASNAWIEQIFEADQARTKGVVRRAIRNVEIYGWGVGNFVEEVRKRGYHVIETGDQLVIFCHEGALKMVADLFSTKGAAEGSEIFRFASDVDSDQREEIDRMRAVLASSSIEK